MTKATITKTLKKLSQEDPKMSLGFRRYWVLPRKIRFNLMQAVFVQTGSTRTHQPIVDFFQNMSDEEYLNWLKTA